MTEDDPTDEVPHRRAEGSGGGSGEWTAIVARLPDLRTRVLRRAVAGPEVRSEWQRTATDAPALLCGPVVLSARAGRIAWTRSTSAGSRRPPDDPQRSGRAWSAAPGDL